MRNIKLAYAINILYNASFWMGIWLLFYLKFTNFTGIGIIESVGIIISVLAEIPTGAIADLLGKKKTLIFAFIFLALGNFVMGAATSFWFLIIGEFIGRTGRALYSGTYEALVYDSLKEQNREAEYEKVIARSNSLALIAVSLSSVIGGFMYIWFFRLPFYANAAMYVIAGILALLLIEPRIDTIKFSLKNFVRQNMMGFSELFKNPHIKNLTFYLLSLYIFMVISWQFLGDALLIEWGYQPQQLGALIAIFYLASAIASHLSPLVSQRFKHISMIIFMTFFWAVGLIISPYIGLILGGCMALMRAIFIPIFENIKSAMLNQHIQSQYRATTLSTFNLLANLPYVLLAFFIGNIIDRASATTFAFYLGILMIIAILYQILSVKKINAKM